jgi:phytoene synthase
MPSDAASHCLDLVRAADKDRFLAALLAPDAGRRGLLALYAFNIELSRVREMVSEPQLGEIRLTWWRDVIDSICAGETPAHPVAQELALAMAAGGLPQSALANMIEARRGDLYDDPMPTLGDLEGYLGETASALIQMAALVLAGGEGAAAAEAAGLAGVAHGITGLLRSLPLHRARGQCYLPGDILARHGLNPAHVLAGRSDAAMTRVLADLVGHAQDRLDEARALRATIPPAAMPAFLPVSLVDLDLKALRKPGFDALNAVAGAGQMARQWRLWRRARAATF